MKTILITAAITALISAMATDIYATAKRKIVDALLLPSIGLQLSGVKVEMEPKRRKYDDRTFWFMGTFYYGTVYSYKITNYDVAVNGRAKLEISHDDGFISQVQCPALHAAKLLDGTTVVDWSTKESGRSELIIELEPPPPGSQTEILVTILREKSFPSDDSLKGKFAYSSGLAIGSNRKVKWSY